MKQPILAVCLFSSIFATSCRTWTMQHFVGAPDYEVARREVDDVSVETFRLEGGDRLRVTTRRETTRPDLGLRLVEIDKSRAERLRREAGSTHEATVALQDYAADGRFVVPLVFDATNGTYEDRWRIGLGLVMGNRNHYVADQSTRRVQTRNVFSALLGLIKVDSGPDETSVRLLWCIRFET